MTRFGGKKSTLLYFGVMDRIWSYWSGLPFPSPEDLPDPEIELISPASPALAGGFITTEPPGKPLESGVSLKPRTAV